MSRRASNLGSDTRRGSNSPAVGAAGAVDNSRRGSNLGGAASADSGNRRGSSLGGAAEDLAASGSRRMSNFGAGKRRTSTGQNDADGDVPEHSSSRRGSNLFSGIGRRASKQHDSDSDTDLNNKSSSKPRRGSSDGGLKNTSRRKSNDSDDQGRRLSNNAAERRSSTDNNAQNRRGSNQDRRLSNANSDTANNNNNTRRRMSNESGAGSDSDGGGGGRQNHRRRGSNEDGVGGEEKSKASKINETLQRRRNNLGGRTRSGDKLDATGLDKLPVEYRYNPKQATPVLHYLPRLMAAVAQRNNPNEPIQLRSLLKAAQGDVRLHRARVQAALERDMKLIRSYQLEHDARYKARLARLHDRKEFLTELKNEKEQILQKIKAPIASGLTQAEKTEAQLANWNRALELYVYDTHVDDLDAEDDDENSVNASTDPDNILSWQTVFEKLLDGISEDQDISQILKDASAMCAKLVKETEKAVDDAAQYMADMESAYVIRLEAHEMFARTSLQQVGYIEEQFKTAGQAALRIGHQLETAELKRSQCESASILIRRWWIMESLAEQEAASGESIPVEMEVNGGIPPNVCRLDHLFTKPENSLEAARALKQLRAVVRSRGNAASSGTQGAAMIIDKSGSQRLDLTSNLITRVSDTLEERLLNQFGKVYNAGGNYDFSLKPRPNSVDWRELRSLAQALLMFDSGRNLHKRYVEMVLETRFPELAEEAAKKKREEEEAKALAESMADENLNTFDMDATRSKLTNLFHRVSEVCTAEFELIGHVFTCEGSTRQDLLEGSEDMPLVVARALLQRVVSDPQHGLQARVNDLLASIDRQGDFDSGAKKLDTFVIIHEKAAGLFNSLRDAADRMTTDEDHGIAVESLKGFLTSQELALSNQHRQSYINLELRLLHHDCCASLDQAGCTLVKGPPPKPDPTLAEKGILEEYRAPVLPLHKDTLKKGSFNGILNKSLKPAVVRQPLIHATDSLARARLMFSTNPRGGETTARVILSIYNQMCGFYGEGYLYPLVETIQDMLQVSAPSSPPALPFNEDEDAHMLGVAPAFWVCLERIHSAAKSFDRELWAEDRGAGSQRVWETLEDCGDALSVQFARGERNVFFAELERRGESAILRALDAISTHVQWILVTGGESMLATGGTRMLGNLTGSSGGPYAIPAGSSLETPNSPAVKGLAYCLRVQFVRIQAALTPVSLANFWTALSMRIYDILVARLLQHYYISTVGAVILSRDVESLRSVAMLAGTEHSHWDVLRELLTLYMTPPDAIKGLLTGPEGEPSKGLFAKCGREKCLVFLSRRNDYRYKTTAGLKKSGWVTEMLTDLRVSDPTDGHVNIAMYAAARMKVKN